MSQKSWCLHVCILSVYLYIQYMKSNTGPTSPQPLPVYDTASLRKSLNREKEALVSMFLANAPLTQLNAQYQLIDELNEKILHSIQ